MPKKMVASNLPLTFPSTASSLVGHYQRQQKSSLKSNVAFINDHGASRVGCNCPMLPIHFSRLTLLPCAGMYLGDFCGLGGSTRSQRLTRYPFQPQCHIICRNTEYHHQHTALESVAKGCLGAIYWYDNDDLADMHRDYLHVLE